MTKLLVPENVVPAGKSKIRMVQEVEELRAKIQLVAF
jgi:hypothetical protein